MNRMGVVVHTKHQIITTISPGVPTMTKTMDQILTQTIFKNREEHFRHLTLDEDLLQYELLKRGDEQAISIGKQMFDTAKPELLSDDILRGWQYMFVASTTLACRYAADGGLDAETAYNLSDLYIQRADKCTTAAEICALHDEMFRDYVNRIKNLNKTEVYSRQILRVLDYIDNHLHDSLTVKTLANYAGITPNYLSALFAKELHMNISEFIRNRRVEAAKILLQYYDYSATEIAEYLHFSSISHFIKVFKDCTGRTPNQYRKEEFRHQISAEDM